jgi:hypothetical protein
MKTTPENLRLTQEIHARLVDIALNEPDREKRNAAADAERKFWNAYVLPIFGDLEIRPEMIDHGQNPALNHALAAEQRSVLTLQQLLEVAWKI